MQYARQGILVKTILQQVFSCMEDLLRYRSFVWMKSCQLLQWDTDRLPDHSGVADEWDQWKQCSPLPTSYVLPCQHTVAVVLQGTVTERVSSS